MPVSARTNDGPVRNKNDLPSSSASSTPYATVSRSEYSVALAITHMPSVRASQQLTNPPRAADPYVGEADAEDVGALDGTAAFLRNEVAQVRCGVAEDRISRVLGLADRDQCRGRCAPIGCRQR